MAIEIKPVCPLGSKCEEIKDGAIHRCAWQVHIRGHNPQTGEPEDRADCAMSWMPVLTLEMSKTNLGQTQAIETFRNAVVSQNNEMLRLQGAEPETIVRSEVKLIN